MTDDEIDLSDSPELTSEQLAKMKLVKPGERHAAHGSRTVVLTPDLADDFATEEEVIEALRLVKQLRDIGKHKKSA